MLRPSIIAALLLLPSCKGFHAEPFVGASAYSDEDYALHARMTFVEDYPEGQEVSPSSTTFPADGALPSSPLVVVNTPDDWAGVPWAAQPADASKPEPGSQAEGQDEGIRWGPFSASASALALVIGTLIAALRKRSHTVHE